MLTMRLSSFAPLLAFLFAAATAGPAAANEPLKAQFDLGQEGVWTSQCEIDRMVDYRACKVVTHRLFDDGKQQGFIALSVIPAGNDYHLFVTSNIGQLQGCALRVDRQPRIESQIATFNMCMFPNFQSGRTAEQFKNGAAVLIRLNYRGGGRRDIDFPLSGFSKSYDEMYKLSQ
jgi:invasion protein IalB